MSRKYYEHEESVTRKVKGWIDVDDTFIQVYSCYLEHSRYINSVITMKLLFWLLINYLDKANGVSSNISMCKSFNDYLVTNKDGSTNTVIGVSERSYWKSLKELRDLRILNKDKNGNLYFDANMFWSGTQRGREVFLINEKNTFSMLDGGKLNKQIANK